MKIKTYFFATFLMSLFLIPAVCAMDTGNQDEIDFQGERKSAIQLIKSACSNRGTDLFASTQVFAYSSKGLKTIGNLWDMLEDDINEIKRGNFVYTSSYKDVDGSPHPLGAFILGTKDDNQITLLRQHFEKR